jgi:hypothetical protein
MKYYGRGPLALGIGKRTPDEIGQATVDGVMNGDYEDRPCFAVGGRVTVTGDCNGCYDERGE